MCHDPDARQELCRGIPTHNCRYNVTYTATLYGNGGDVPLEALKEMFQHLLFRQSRPREDAVVWFSGILRFYDGFPSGFHVM